MPSIIKKIPFIFCCVFFVVSVTGCEDKAEKRAKLVAQIQQSQKDYDVCLHEAYIKNREDFSSKCRDEKKIVDELKEQLDKLNGVK